MFNGKDSKAARKICPSDVGRAARRRLGYIDAAEELSDLRIYGLEKLKGNRDGQHSIRVNDQYRICFTWSAHAGEDVEMTDYH